MFVASQLFKYNIIWRAHTRRLFPTKLNRLYQAELSMPVANSMAIPVFSHPTQWTVELGRVAMGRRDYLSKLKYVQIPRLELFISCSFGHSRLFSSCGDMRTCSENPQMSTLAVVDLCCLLDRSFNNLKATPLWLSYSAPGRQYLQCTCACAEMLDVPARAEAQ